MTAARKLSGVLTHGHHHVAPGQQQIRVSVVQEPLDLKRVLLRQRMVHFGHPSSDQVSAPADRAAVNMPVTSNAAILCYRMHDRLPAATRKRRVIILCRRDVKSVRVRCRDPKLHSRRWQSRRPGAHSTSLQTSIQTYECFVLHFKAGFSIKVT
jgi:hypothetical protein